MASERDLALLEELMLAEDLDRARSGNLLAFTLLTKSDYEVAWHNKLTAKYLTDFARKKIRRLIITEPPRHGKSELTSRRLPALLHGMYPNDEILAASYNAEIAGDNTVDVQRIMDRLDYQTIFPMSKITAEGSASKYTRKKNEHELIPIKLPDKYHFIPTGSYRSAGVGGSFTGRGANWILIDDPVKNREDADSKTFRETLWKFYTSTLRTRLEGEGSILLTLTRWHEDDLAGRLLKLAKSDPDADQWVVLDLPAIKDERTQPGDPRKLGEPLWPGKFNLDQLLKLKASVGARDWSALFQQQPTTEGGNIIKREWIRFYNQLPERFDQVIQTWDFAVKDKTTSDFTVGQVWGRRGTDKYLLAEIRGRFSFPVACQKLLELSKAYPLAYRKLIEGKANGPAIVQTLRQQVTGLVEVEPMGDKVARLNAVAPEYESGHVYYPHPSIAPWIDDHIEEMLNFPNATNDDRVDATSQGLNELRKASTLHLPFAGHGSGAIFQNNGR